MGFKISLIRQKRYLLLAVIMIAVLLYWLFHSMGQNQRSFGSGSPATGVLATKIQQMPWQATYQTVGSFITVHGVAISSQVTGTISQINFRSGEHVSKGDVLLKIDDSELQAQLSQKEAQLTLAELNFNRLRRLLNENAISKSSYDQAKATYNELAGAVKQIQAELNFYTIRAPFDGTIGLRTLNVGQLVQPGTLLVNLQQYNPIYLDFSLPQTYVSRSLIGKSVKVEASLDAQNKYFKGTITSIDSQLNADSRTLMVRAEIPNPNNELMPGMFAQVSIPINKKQQVLMVPSSAILNSLYGTYIFVLQHNDKNQLEAMQTPVDATADHGDQVIISGKGLRSGQLIVKMGAFKLRNHETVQLIGQQEASK